MSISYSGVVGFKGKATLPSVDSWGENMNILRDPPKSITTRKIDKVGQTSEITQMIQESGDRAVEVIKVYARGTNPMVSVSYDNYGTNGGMNIRRSGQTPQSFLPYRVMRDGAFRPPVRDQRDLLPISRLPRNWTSSFSQPGFVNFAKKAMEPTPDARGTKKPEQILKACANPNITYTVQVPVSQTYDVKHKIQSPLQVSAKSGVNSQKKINAEWNIGDSAIQNNLHPEFNVNKNAIKREGGNTVITERYTHDPLQGQFESNRSRNINTTSIEELFSGDPNDNIKDSFNISHNAPMSHYTKSDYLTTEHELERVLPYHEATTNGHKNIYKKIVEPVEERGYSMNHPTTSAYTNRNQQRIGKQEVLHREYNLKPTINAGGFEGVPTRPVENNNYTLPEFDSEKSRMRQRIFDMQMNRLSYAPEMK